MMKPDFTFRQTTGALQTHLPNAAIKSWFATYWRMCKLLMDSAKLDVVKADADGNRQMLTAIR